MKWVVNGVTYNTATSTAVARSAGEEGPDGKAYEDVLYQTRGGAFFLHEHKEWAIQRDGEWVERESNDPVPMTEEEARKWVISGETEILSNVFETPPEAASETSPGATIYLRLPAALKQSIERAATKADQSINVWAMRCLEQCVKGAAE